MNTEVRDALPDFVNNRIGGLDAVTMKEHIESCADCQAEVAILRDVRASAMLAPQIDANRITAAIPAYGAVRPQPGVSRRPWLMAAAAAIVAIGGFALVNRPAANDAAVTVGVVASAPTAAAPAESDATVSAPSVSTASSEKSAPKEVDVASLSLVGSTDDLSDADLESLVAALDGIESVPSAEPGSVTTTVDDIDGTNDQ